VASHRKGNRYSVMVEVRMPKHHDLAVKKQKDIVDMQTQLPAVINQAFTAIEKQLKKTVALRRHDEKTHANGQPHGTVEKVFGEEGYGFIRTVDDDRQFYFHRNSVLHDDFDNLTVGTEVRFTAELGDEGPQASSVQVVARHSGQA
jgi:cold shock CspA family protein